MSKDKKNFKITILETSDIHGAIFPIDYKDNSRVEIGLAKIATIIKEEREKNKNIILIDNGDLIQGNPFTYYYSKINSNGINPMIKVLNYLKYDAAVLGNHEFDYGQEILTRAISESNFPWICGNIMKIDSEECFYGKPYIIKRYECGLKIGILGLITQYVPNWESPENIEGMEFRNPVEYLQKWISVLKEIEEVDIIIVCYHGGFEVEFDSKIETLSLTGENQGYEICTKFPDIDVLLTGHQHRYIYNKEINTVLIMQPGSYGDSLGKITLELEYEGTWKIISKKSELLSVYGVQEDTEVLNLIEEYELNTQRWLDRPIGKINGDMVVRDHLTIRLKDNPLIEFINMVQMDAAGVDISCTSLFSDYCPGLKANVTMRDIVSNYIYPNTLKVLRVTGKDIKDALEKSAAYFSLVENVASGRMEIKTSGIQPYNYDMWEGIEYIIDISRPIGSRVIKLEYKNHEIDLSREYDVVINNYRASGGGEFHMFKGKLIVEDIPTDVSELIANYILKRENVDVEINNNWKVIYTEL